VGLTQAQQQTIDLHPDILAVVLPNGVLLPLTDVSYTIEPDYEPVFARVMPGKHQWHVRGPLNGDTISHLNTHYHAQEFIVLSWSGLIAECVITSLSVLMHPLGLVGTIGAAEWDGILVEFTATYTAPEPDMSTEEFLALLNQLRGAKF
jgi:hypothetical protein